MTTRRRLFAVLVAGALALVGLAGCRSDSAVAAYVGTATFTEDRVTQILDDAKVRLDAAVREQFEAQARAAKDAGQPAPSAPPQIEVPISRQDVVIALVGREVFKAAAERRGLSPVEVDSSELAGAFQLPAEAEFIRIYGEYVGYRFALAGQVAPKTPTEADLRDVYDRLKAAGGVEPGTSFAQWQPTVQGQGLQLIAQMLGLREVVTAEVVGANVAVNPRYGADVELLAVTDTQQRRHPIMVVRLDGKVGPPAVVDAG